MRPADAPDTSSSPAAISATRPTPLGAWWLRNRWDELTFLHWPYEPAGVQALLPNGRTADTFDGQAWVSLGPVQMREATPRWCPPIPWVSNFAETNVRTYVVDSAGNRAVWFFSLEADRLPIVAFARLLLGFPYVWADLAVERTTTGRRYETAGRRWPSRPNSSTEVEIEIGDVIAEPSDLDVFLTARWGTVAQWPTGRLGRWGKLRHHPVDHPEWTLRSAELVSCDDRSFQAAGLPAPTGQPIVRYVDGIDARFGRPIRV